MFGLVSIPDESVLSRTWRKRFDEAAREFITTAAHFLVKEIHDRSLPVPEARPKEEVLDPAEDPLSCPTKDNESEEEFMDREIFRTKRLAREYCFSPFNSGRAENASYDDTQFFELQTFMGMVGCGTAQGVPRFKLRRGNGYSPHGDTHLRAVKQFSPEELVDGFNEATDGEHVPSSEQGTLVQQASIGKP